MKIEFYHHSWAWPWINVGDLLLLNSLAQVKVGTFGRRR